MYASISARTLWTLGPAAAVEVIKGHVSALGGSVEAIVPGPLHTVSMRMQSQLLASLLVFRPDLRDGGLSDCANFSVSKPDDERAAGVVGCFKDHYIGVRVSVDIHAVIRNTRHGSDLLFQVNWWCRRR